VGKYIEPCEISVDYWKEVLWHKIGLAVVTCSRYGSVAVFTRGC